MPSWCLAIPESSPRPPNRFIQSFESRRPGKLGGLGVVVAFHVGLFTAFVGFDVFEFGVAEDFFEHFGEARIVFLEFGPGVDVVVVVVVFAIVVEPGLDTFSEVFGVGDAGVLPCPETFFEGLFPDLSESLVEVKINSIQAAKMKSVGKLMNEDVFLVVRIPFEAE